MSECDEVLLRARAACERLESDVTYGLLAFARDVALAVMGRPLDWEGARHYVPSQPATGEGE